MLNGKNSKIAPTTHEADKHATDKHATHEAEKHKKDTSVAKVAHAVETKVEKVVEKVEHAAHAVVEHAHVAVEHGHDKKHAVVEKIVKAILPLKAHADTNPDVPFSLNDWSGFVGFTPSMIFQPTSIEQLITFLNQNISGASGKIRALGGLHSCSTIAVGDIVINVANLPKTVEWSADLTNVTATANWSFHDFLLQLSANKMSIQATGGTDQQTLAVSNIKTQFLLTFVLIFDIIY